MKKMRRLLLLSTVLFFCLPVIVTVLFQRNVKALFYGPEKIERYLPGILYAVTNEEMHMETLKAMAVLVRSNVVNALENETVTYEDLQTRYSLATASDKRDNQAFYESLVQACEETKGEVVCYNDKICKCPFFYSSNGTTRDAYTFFGDDSYPYLVPVPSHKDEECPSYITYHHFSQEDFSEIMKDLSEDTFENQIQILETDDSGYVTWVQIGKNMVGGETFRQVLKLSSCCFSIEQTEEGIRIACKGRGHGFGFSQYGANAMAEEKSYQELIAYYFHNITIENMYTFS